MSNNGYAAPHLEELETASTANLWAQSGIRNSARVHLNGNVAPPHRESVACCRFGRRKRVISAVVSLPICPW